MWRMKKIVLLLLIALSAMAVNAQSEKKPFKAYIYNNVYEVYIRMNLYDNDVRVPGQELYGELPGFLGKRNNSFCWVMAGAEITGERTATLQMVNDFGSEDLTATLTCVNDSTYMLRQEKGSTIRVPSKGKWVKLPKTIGFKRKN